jgi:four helix bundle protein
MKYRSFEDLPVWKTAADMARRTYRFTELPVFRGHRALRDQLERAAVSVSNNIAEGFERGTTKELLSFLYVARGSAGEVRSMLSVLECLTAFEKLKSQISDLKLQCMGISRQLYGWCDYLKSTSITGQRHMTPSHRPRSQISHLTSQKRK